MTSVTVSTETRDHLAVLKEDLGYESWDELLSDIAEYIEENIDAFDEAFPEDEDEDEVEE
jgi:predicted CopG family antitoxin